jgi:hypothetical protein
MKGQLKLPRRRTVRHIALACERLETRSTVSDVVISTVTLPFLTAGLLPAPFEW